MITMITTFEELFARLEERGLYTDIVKARYRIMLDEKRKMDTFSGASEEYEEAQLTRDRMRSRLRMTAWALEDLDVITLEECTALTNYLYEYC